MRQEIDRRIQEKEEEFDHSKKNHARALDSMQASLEAEARAKEEALRKVTVHCLILNKDKTHI